MNLFTPTRLPQSIRDEYVTPIMCVSSLLVFMCTVSGFLIGYHITASFMLIQLICIIGSFLFVKTNADIFIHLAVATGIMHFQLWFFVEDFHNPPWSQPVIIIVYTLVSTFDVIYTTTSWFVFLKQEHAFVKIYPYLAEILILSCSVLSGIDVGFMHMDAVMDLVAFSVWLVFAIIDRKTDFGMHPVAKCAIVSYTSSKAWFIVIPFITLSLFKLKGASPFRSPVVVV
jgi:hypothetical protein